MESKKKINKFDIDIEIKDLLWEFIRRWRIIVILAVICGVALTAYQYRLDINKTDVVTVKKSQEELEKAMGEQDLDEVTAAVALLRQLNQKSEYMEKSVLMKVNPYEENAVILQYYVDAETDKMATDVSDAYKAYVENDLLAQAIAEAETYELETVYLAELISVEKEAGHIYINAKDESVNLAIQPREAEHSINIKVVGQTAEQAEKIANDVKDGLNKYSSTVSGTVGVHQLKLIEESTGIVIDQSLAEQQNWNATAIKTISNNLDSMKNEMTSEQVSLYVYRTTVTEKVDVTKDSVAKSASISIKHLIIGVLIGIILACCIIFVLYLFAAALRSDEEIKLLYDTRVLGCVDDSTFQKKKLFGFVDAFVLKVKNAGKKKLTFEQEIQMICSNILLSCEKNSSTEILLATSAMECIPKNVITAIVDRCAEKNISVQIGFDIAYDAETLEKLAKIGHVVFIEKKHASLYNEIYKEVVLCKEHGINVIGMIVVGV